jgi:Ca2+:H+ antiporter
MPSYIETRTRIVGSVAIAATVAALLLLLAGFEGVPIFVASALALAGLAALVGDGTDQLGARMGPGPTGVLQSALGNLPELFIGIFALRAGMVELVRSALVGSILANTLLVLGLAFMAGGLRHGPQRFGATQTRMVASLLILAVASMTIPTIATAPGGPDQGHATELSVIVSIVLLVVFAASIPFSLSQGAGATESLVAKGQIWPLGLAIGTLLMASVAAAFVADWFVEALRPAMGSLGMSESFAGLVVVAIAGNAVEHVVGIQAMARNRCDLGISLILNSSLQVALALTPVLVILSLVMGGAAMTLVLSPLLVASLALTTLLAALVVIDGESTWLEGLALVGLYVIVAASVWWGPVIS